MVVGTQLFLFIFTKLKQQLLVRSFLPSIACFRDILDTTQYKEIPEVVARKDSWAETSHF